MLLKSNIWAYIVNFIIVFHVGPYIVVIDTKFCIISRQYNKYFSYCSTEILIVLHYGINAKIVSQIFYESGKFVQLCQSYAVIVISVILISFYVFLISGHYD